MRICHVVEAGGGVGQVIIDLVRHNLASGHDVTVIFALSRAEPHFIKSLSVLLGTKLIPIPMQRKIGLHDIVDTGRLYRCLRRAGPFDIIHGHSSKAGALLRLIGFLFPQSVKIYSPHAFVTLDPKAPFLYRIFEKILSWFGGTIVTLSTVEKEHALRQLHINPEKIVTIPNGIEIDYPADRTTARRYMGYDDKTFVVGFVGRFVSQKNPLRLIEAFGMAARVDPSLRLAMIGDGELRKKIDATLAALHLQDNIRYFSGHIGRDLMPGFDCLICSSDYEGFALVFLEALAAGVPIVTTPVGGAHETVINGETGFITADFTAEGLSSALLQLASHGPEKRGYMSDTARRYVQKFSLERVGGQMQSLYAMLLGKQGA